MTRNAETKFLSTEEMNLSRLVFSIFPDSEPNSSITEVIPALFTRTSNEPNSFFTLLIKFLTSSSLVKSAIKKGQFNSLARSLIRSLLPVMKTLEPIDCKNFAEAKPIPLLEPAPVINDAL